MALTILAGCKHSDPVNDLRTENSIDTAWGIAYLTGYLFNGYIATRPTGAHDVTVQCTGGGSVRIEGRTEYNRQSGILSMDLTYVFAEAHAVVATTNLAVSFHPLSGTIALSGSLRTAGDPYENTVASSTGLVYDVTVNRSDLGASALTDDGPYAVHIWTSTNRLGQVYRNMAGELDSTGFAWEYCVSASCGGSTNTYGIYVGL